MGRVRRRRTGREGDRTYTTGLRRRGSVFRPSRVPSFLDPSSPPPPSLSPSGLRTFCGRRPVLPGPSGDTRGPSDTSSPGRRPRGPTGLILGPSTPFRRRGTSRPSDPVSRGPPHLGQKGLQLKHQIPTELGTHGVVSTGDIRDQSRDWYSDSGREGRGISVCRVGDRNGRRKSVHSFSRIVKFGVKGGESWYPFPRLGSRGEWGGWCPDEEGIGTDSTRKTQNVSEGFTLSLGDPPVGHSHPTLTSQHTFRSKVGEGLDRPKRYTFEVGVLGPRRGKTRRETPTRLGTGCRHNDEPLRIHPRMGHHNTTQTDTLFTHTLITL